MGAITKVKIRNLVEKIKDCLKLAEDYPTFEEKFLNQAIAYENELIELRRI